MERAGAENSPTPPTFLLHSSHLYATDFEGQV